MKVSIVVEIPTGKHCYLTGKSMCRFYEFTWCALFGKHRMEEEKLPECLILKEVK